MIFILLHQGETKEELRVQVSHIVAISHEADEFNNAFLVLTNGPLQCVNETPEQIMAMLQSFAARTQMTLPPGVMLKG